MPEFFSSFGLKLTAAQVVREVARFIKGDVHRTYKVMIGTDSERLPGNRADFVTAVAVHRVGNGGRYFWRRSEFQHIHTLRDRILKEVLVSLDVARVVVQELRQISLPSFDFEIHVDVGENGPTQPMIQEVVAMIRANNFEARTKPESYAASKVADRHV